MGANYTAFDQSSKTHDRQRQHECGLVEFVEMPIRINRRFFLLGIVGHNETKIRIRGDESSRTPSPKSHSNLGDVFLRDRIKTLLNRLFNPIPYYSIQISFFLILIQLLDCSYFIVRSHI